MLKDVLVGCDNSHPRAASCKESAHLQHAQLLVQARRSEPRGCMFTHRLGQQRAAAQRARAQGSARCAPPPDSRGWRRALQRAGGAAALGTAVTAAWVRGGRLSWTVEYAQAFDAAAAAAAAAARGGGSG